MNIISGKLPLTLLKSNRNLRYLWIGESVSAFGDFFFDIAILWYVYQTTGSGLKSGVILVLQFLPTVIAGPVFGVVADRVHRKRFMIIASVIQSVVTGVLAVLMAMHDATLLEIYAATVLLAVAGQAYGPARAGIFPDLVAPEELMRANSMFSLSQQAARLIGSTAGGAVMAFIGAASAVGFDAVTFVGAALALARVAYNPLTTDGTATDSPNWMKEMADGWRWIAQRPVMVMLISLGVVSNIALGPTNVLPPMLMQRHLHVGATGLGVFDASVGLGVMIGGVMLGSIGGQRVGILYACGIGMQGVSMLLVAMAPALWFACLANCMLGFSVILTTLPMSTMFQILIPRDMRGRVNAISSSLFTIAIPITYASVGALGDAIGARWSYGLAGVLAVVCMLVGILTPSLRRLTIGHSSASESLPAIQA